MSRKTRNSNGMKSKKSGAIGSRLDPALRSRLDKIAERYGISDATMLQDALTALADYVAEAQRYVRPMKMVFDREMAEPVTLVAEARVDFAEKERAYPVAEAEIVAQRCVELIEAHPFTTEPRMGPEFVMAVRQKLAWKMEEASTRARERAEALRRRIRGYESV